MEPSEILGEEGARPADSLPNSESKIENR
jgi:hypothetical protein